MIDASLWFFKITVEDFGTTRSAVILGEGKDAVAARYYLGIDHVYYQPVDRGVAAEICRGVTAIRAELCEANTRQRSTTEQPLPARESTLPGIES